jgi:hypothetical protein
MATGVRVWIQVAGRDGQHFDFRYAWLRSLQDCVDEIGVNFSDFAAGGTLHFDLAARVGVIRQWFGPDHTEMLFAIRTHEQTVARHGTPASWIEVQVGEAGTAFYFFFCRKSNHSELVES